MIEYRARPHQRNVLRSRKRYIFLGGGVGCGKTDTGTLWHLVKCINETPPGVIGLITANSYTQLIDSTMRNVYRNYARLGILAEPPELPRTHRPFNIQIWNGSHWVEILCRSLEKFELLAGIEIGWFWADEVWQTRREAFELLQARLRDKRMANTAMAGLLTTTLDDPGSWLYDVFVDHYEPDLMDVFYATTYDNARNLPQGFIEGLKATYSKPLFERMVMCKWVSLSGALVYYNFARADHVSEEATFDHALPILWSLDFNIGERKPMSSCLCQIKKGPGPDGRLRPELHVFDEIILDTSDTHDAAEEFKNRMFGDSGFKTHPYDIPVIIYGDASGRNRDTRSRQTDYTILSLEGFKKQRIPAHNPPLRDRHNAVNGLLRNVNEDVRLKIHPRCKTLIKGLETVKLKSGTDYLEEETREQHVTTALGYLICQEFPLLSGGNKPYAVFG
jgi:hypothetical protein